MMMPKSLENHPLAPEIKTILDAVHRASLLCRDIRKSRDNSNIGIQIKSDNSPVTIADICSQLIINRAIQRDFPTDGIIGEEEESELTDDLVANIQHHIGEALAKPEIDAILKLKVKPSEANRNWVIDPIDGTKGYIRGDQYAVCVALIDASTHQPILAALGCPNLCNSTLSTTEGVDADRLAGLGLDDNSGLLLLSVAGVGNFKGLLNDELGEAGMQQIAKPLKDSNLDRVLVIGAFESCHTDPFEIDALKRNLQITHSHTIRVDSQCKYALVALNLAQIYYRHHRKSSQSPVLDCTSDYCEKSWDNAAGYLFIKEAGGSITDFCGNELSFPPSPTFHVQGGIISTMLSDHLHRAVLDAINKIGQQ